LKQELGFTDQQADRYTTMLERGQRLAGNVSP
jgi:sugar-specific transcriptional regulator TrmB